MNESWIKEVLEWYPQECNKVKGRRQGKWMDEIRKQKPMKACWRRFHPALDGE